MAIFPAMHTSALCSLATPTSVHSLNKGWTTAAESGEPQVTRLKEQLHNSNLDLSEIDIFESDLLFDGHQNLVGLKLSGPKMSSDTCIRLLESLPSLLYLDISDTSFIDQRFFDAVSRSHLISLNLSDTPLDNLHMDAVFQCLSRLECLNLASATASGLYGLHHLQDLECLNLNYCTSVDAYRLLDQDLMEISQLPKLKHLRMATMPESDADSCSSEAVAQLFNNLQLETLDVSESFPSPDLQAIVLQALSKMPLQSLNLAENNIFGSNFLQLQRLPSVHLDLSRNDLREQEMRHLSQLMQRPLLSINLTGTARHFDLLPLGHVQYLNLSHSMLQQHQIHALFDQLPHLQLQSLVLKQNLDAVACQILERNLPLSTLTHLSVGDVCETFLRGISQSRITHLEVGKMLGWPQLLATLTALKVHNRDMENMLDLLPQTTLVDLNLSGCDLDRHMIQDIIQIARGTSIQHLYLSSDTLLMHDLDHLLPLVSDRRFKTVELISNEFRGTLPVLPGVHLTRGLYPESIIDFRWNQRHCFQLRL
ncbi:hypothetical protein EDD86DRAFT_73343 [Gorgonomyces haynaldii]|nr:hypothetical protein EDD86DRAFT_73343 [Gorgonomyces haynaldii]